MNLIKVLTILMDKANKFINQKNQRLSFNSVNDFKSEKKNWRKYCGSYSE